MDSEQPVTVLTYANGSPNGGRRRWTMRLLLAGLAVGVAAAAFVAARERAASRAAERARANVAALATALATPPPPPAPRSGPLTREQMEADLRELAAGVTSAWAYLDDKRDHFGVDVDATLRRSLDEVARARSDADFGPVVRRFMAALQEGHAEAAVGHLTPPPGRYWPVALRPVAEGLCVTAVAATTAADDAVDRNAGGAVVRPRVGDLLRRVDGRAVEELLDDARRHVSASTPLARLRLAAERLPATHTAAVELELERPDGSSHACRVRTLDAPVAPPGPPATDRFAEWQHEIEPDVGYLRVPTFAWRPPQPPATGSVQDLDRAVAPAKDELDAAFAGLADRGALVLDLRGNRGGSVFLASYVAEHLVPPGFVYHAGRRRRSPEALRMPDLAALPSGAWEGFNAWRPSEMAGVRHARGPSHAGQLVVLVDELCFSATDDLLACLADLRPGVRFVGRPTHGGTGEPRAVLTLRHSRVTVFFCIQEMQSPAGRPIEGRGTVPHVAVEWTRDDVLHGRDPDLAAAIGEARRPSK